jgi:CRISPR-associated protein Cas2
MTQRQQKSWLIGYDIRDPQRLQRVHKRLKAEGCSVQYSAFSVRANDRQLDALLSELSELIDKRVDDVRAYHLPERCVVWTLGRQALPDGVLLQPPAVARLLLRSDAAQHAPAISPVANAD